MHVIDTGTPDLRATIDDGVALLTMDRPERRNALSGQMIAALGATLALVEADDDVGSVVLTGAGGAFCAGGDVKAMAAEAAASAGHAGGQDGGRPASGERRIQQQRRDHRAVSGRLWAMPKPTIAAISGPAAGAGLSLALACDLRYAVAGAVLSTSFARMAYPGDYGGTFFLTQLVGTGKARELYFFADQFSASEGERLGIINQIFAEAEFEAEVMARARRLAAGPRTAYSYMKEDLNRAVQGDLGECLDMEATHTAHNRSTPDHLEAVQAFVEKRPPRFGGARTP